MGGSVAGKPDVVQVRQRIADLENAGYVNRGGKSSHRNSTHPKGLRVNQPCTAVSRPKPLPPGWVYFGTPGNTTSADMPARRSLLALSSRTFTPNTCLMRSSTVCTLRGVNSAARLICSTMPVKSRP